MTQALVHPADVPVADTTVSVRAATMSELAIVADLRLALLREYGDHAIYGRLHPHAAERAADLCAEQMASAYDVFLLAFMAGAAVGLLRCSEQRCSPLLTPARYAYLSSAYVRPPFRRRGVLKALLRSADAWCAERGMDQMRLHHVPGGIAAMACSTLGFDTVEVVRLRNLEGR